MKSDTVFFFDMDGTLIDTESANFQAYYYAVKTVIGEEIIYSPTQRFNRKVLQSLFPNLSQSQFAQIISEKERNYQRFLNCTTLNNSYAGVIRQYAETHPIYIVTNSRKNRAFQTLRYHHIIEDIDRVFFFTEDRIANKFENAINVLGIDPRRIIAFENEAKEVQNAHQTGILFINPLKFR